MTDITVDAAAPPTSATARAAVLSVGDVLTGLTTSAGGLSSAQAADQLASHGANVLPGRHLGAFGVLLRQLRSPLLALLAVATATLRAACRFERLKAPSLPRGGRRCRSAPFSA